MNRRARVAVLLFALMGAPGSATAQRPNAPPKPRTLSTPLRVCSGGDVTLGTNLDPVWAKLASDSLMQVFGLRDDPDTLVQPLRELLAGADVVLLNIEGAIGEGPVPPKCGPQSTRCFAFRQPPASAAALRGVVDSGVAMVGNIANNHSRDAGDAGRDTTVAYLERAGIFVTGRDTLATPVATRFGDTIAMLGFHTDSTVPDARDLAAVRRHVARAAARYGTVIVTMHLGAEGVTAQRTRDGIERFLGLNRGNPVGFANAAFRGGATLVIGHGPHVLRAAEWRGDRLVFYSLGNLLTYGPFRMREPIVRSAVVCATIDSAGHVSAAELRPTVQLAAGVLRRDSTRRAFALIDSLSALDFPRSGVTIDSAGVVGKRPPPPPRHRKPAPAPAIKKP